MLQNDAAVKHHMPQRAVIITISVVVAVEVAAVTVIKSDKDLGVGGGKKNLRPVHMIPLFPWPSHLGITKRI